MSEKLLTIEEVGRRLGLSEEAIRDLVEKGELPAYKIGGSFLRFKVEQVERYSEKRESAAMAQRALLQDRGERGSPAGRTAKGISWSGRKDAAKAAESAPYTFWERLEDFLYYNDFYILSFVLLILIVLVVFEF